MLGQGNNLDRPGPPEGESRHKAGFSLRLDGASAGTPQNCQRTGRLAAGHVSGHIAVGIGRAADGPITTEHGSYGYRSNLLEGLRLPSFARRT